MTGDTGIIMYFDLRSADGAAVAATTQASSAMSVSYFLRHTIR